MTRRPASRMGDPRRLLAVVLLAVALGACSDEPVASETTPTTATVGATLDATAGRAELTLAGAADRSFTLDTLVASPSAGTRVVLQYTAGPVELLVEVDPSAAAASVTSVRSGDRYFIGECVAAVEFDDGTVQGFFDCPALTAPDDVTVAVHATGTFDAPL
jgi:hypothetical protein